MPYTRKNLKADLADIGSVFNGEPGLEFRAAVELLASGRFPFADVPKGVARLDGVSELLATMAGERDDAPPPFAVLVP